MGFLTFLPFCQGEGRRVADDRDGADPGVYRRCLRELVCGWIGAGSGVGDGPGHRGPDRGSASWRCCRCRWSPGWCRCPRIGIALNGTSSVLYGTVPRMVAPEAAARLQHLLHRYDRVGRDGADLLWAGGDAVGVPLALAVVATLVLATLPLVLLIRRQVAAEV